MNKELNLKALILVGGFGTRLRPLTFTKPKPLIEFCNKPTLYFQIEALVKVGVNEIILAINYKPERMIDFISEMEKKFNIKIRCSIESVPLGTAGPIGLARDNYLKDVKFDYMFVFNADITCTYPLDLLLEHHIKTKAEGTICVTKVKDPSKYGVILTDETSKINSFIEKPQVFISDKINAGIYLFSSEFLNRIETKPCSIEREIFPKVAEEGKLFAMTLEGFWMDIGQPRDYLTGTALYLNHLNSHSKEGLLKESKNIIGAVMCDSINSSVSDGAILGPNVVIGKNCVIKSGCRIKNAVILDGTTVDENAYIEGSIIGWNNNIGKWARVNGLSVLGEEVNVSNEVLVESSIILPNLTIKSNTKENSIILC